MVVVAINFIDRIINSFVKVELPVSVFVYTITCFVINRWLRRELITNANVAARVAVIFTIPRGVDGKYCRCFRKRGSVISHESNFAKRTFT